jgi:hypothetical protein
MTPETTRRILSTIVLALVSALAAGLVAVVKDQSFVTYLASTKLSPTLIPVVTLFLYQVVAFILNKFPSVTPVSTTASFEKKERILI